MPLFIPYPVICLAVAWSLLAAPARAQSLADLEARLADHPSLKALVHQAEASHQNSLAATALPDPTVLIGINNFPVFDPSFSRFLPTNKAIGVRQAFPGRARRNALAGQARVRTRRSQLVRMAQQATLRGELISLLYDVERIKRQRQLVLERSERYDELIEITRSEINAGRSLVFRLAEIDSERAEVTRWLINLEQQQRKINARLTDLVGMVPATPAPSVSPVMWSGEAEDFHAVRVADTDIQLATHRLDQAKAAWKPDWSVNLTYQQRDQGTNFAGDDWISGAVTFSVPLWASGSQRPRLRAAKANLASAEMRYQATARHTAARYAAYAADWQAARDTIAIHQNTIAAVKERIAAQRAIYQSGAGDYTPIVDGRIALLKLRADIADERARMGSAIARMNALVVIR